MSGQSDENFLAMLSGWNGDKNSNWYKMQEKLKRDEEKQQQLLKDMKSKGVLGFGEEEPREIEPQQASAPEPGKSYRISDTHTYIAIPNADSLDHTMPKTPQPVTEKSILQNLQFMDQLASARIDVSNIKEVGKKLAEHAKGKDPEALKKDPAFNHAHAVFCAAQHKALAEYHEAHAASFARSGNNAMAELARHNMRISLNDAAINMHIASQWEEKVRERGLGVDVVRGNVPPTPPPSPPFVAPRAAQPLSVTGAPKMPEVGQGGDGRGSVSSDDSGLQAAITVRRAELEKLDTKKSLNLAGIDDSASEGNRSLFSEEGSKIDDEALRTGTLFRKPIADGRATQRRDPTVRVEPQGDANTSLSRPKVAPAQQPAADENVDPNIVATKRRGVMFVPAGVGFPTVQNVEPGIPSPPPKRRASASSVDEVTKVTKEPRKFG